MDAKTRLAQKIERLKEKQAQLNDRERKQRTRNLIALGGLIQKAGLEDLPTNQLLGALLSIADQKDTLEIKTLWGKRGAEAFQKNTPQPQKDYPLLVVTFKTQPPLTVRQQLRTAGLRWNKLRSNWEGRVNPIDITPLIHTHQGEVRVE